MGHARVSFCDVQQAYRRSVPLLVLPMDFLIGGLNPGTVNMPPPPPQKSGPTRIRTADPGCCGLLCYHSTSSCVLTICFPTAWSLLSKNF